MITMSDSLRYLLLDGFDVAFPGGSTLELLDPDGVVLATFTIPDGAWVAASGGMKRLRDAWDFYALANGTVASYVLKNEAHEERGTVTQGDGDGDMRLDSTAVIVGTFITVASP